MNIKVWVKTFGCLLANCQLNVSRLSGNCQPTFSGHSTNYRLRVGRQAVDVSSSSQLPRFALVSFCNIIFSRIALPFQIIVSKTLFC